MNKVVILNHPLIDHKMAKIRDKRTGTKEFRESVSEVGGLITYEITRDFKTKPKTIETPICEMIVHELEKQVVIVPILRAGLGMVDGIHNIIPTAKIGHIGLYRDEETLQPQVYYSKFPKDIKDSVVLVVDPMLATAGSACKAIDILKEHGATDIRYVGLVGCPEGIDRLQKEHPNVSIYLAALDTHLDENGYIVPGLGDCGDRLFGTK
ncbi:uracil phosphoribosyltransferase [Peloplasma aerotolerans]|jgi:uracil phosphoribosyltransferase|uniref:Uracil phosphoribosyltransferase n=1 Tax=Peloplasma aerotolerans TaxID=3044389 RepID=A0AAW6U9Y9_9MOLU|nr:uracil phosphoribosyltransferase [Mariniplasma sp. M4Ah]MDI6453494.1 uracil phosphoribosyltransferase [Mariniplasma sp. M4Ah]MDR4968217.1 uracil phosphoribosyltransferase [Acholeplasmataceae bacterium]